MTEYRKSLPEVNLPTFKNTNDVLKEKIIASNPDFNSLKWEDFEFKVRMANTDVGEVNTHTYVDLVLKQDQDIQRFYRNKDLKYTFKFEKIDGTAWLKEKLNDFITGEAFDYDIFDNNFLRAKFGESSLYRNDKDANTKYFALAGSIDGVFEKTDESSVPDQTEYLFKFEAGKTTELMTGKVLIVKKVQDTGGVEYFVPENGDDIGIIWFKRELVEETEMRPEPSQPSNLDLSINASDLAQ